MIKGVHHIAIGVPDLDQALQFYRDVLGFSVEQETEITEDHEKAGAAVGIPGFAARMAMLETGNIRIELWQYSKPEQRDRRSDPADLGYPHFALEVEDIEAECERLSSAGMTFVGPPVDFEPLKAVYGRDPFGNLIELLEVK